MPLAKARERLKGTVKGHGRSLRTESGTRRCGVRFLRDVASGAGSHESRMTYDPGGAKGKGEGCSYIHLCRVCDAGSRTNEHELKNNFKSLF